MIKFFRVNKIINLNHFGVKTLIFHHSNLNYNTSKVKVASSYIKFNFSQKSQNDFSDLDENDVKTIEKLQYDFIDKSQDSLDIAESLTKIGNGILRNMKCQGCGIHMQTENESKIGYIPPKKLNEFINLSNNQKGISEVISQPLKEEEIIELKEFERIHDKRTLKKIMKLKKDGNVLICERCFKLKNYLNFENLNEKKEKPKVENSQKSKNYIDLVKKIDPDKLIHQIMSRISNKAHVFYICDISELEATINKNILKIIRDRQIPMTFIVNKYDILPLKVVEERVKIWVGEYLKSLTADIEGLDYSYLLTSSANGHNFDYVIHRIKKIKENAKAAKTPRPKIFVLGNTNVGKSTFINKLIRRANRHLSDSRLNKLNYEKDYRLTDESIYSNDDKSNLTSSPLPGTTIGITKVESMKMGVKLFDTPGIPNPSSLNFLMENCIDIVSSTIRNKIVPFTCSIKQGYSIWIGALCRVDFLNGEDKYLSFFFSHHITIHRTPFLNAEEIFNKHAGTLLRPALTNDLNKLDLVKHIFNLKCDIFSLLNFDIVISGLGWFSISGKGLVSLEVNLPRGVGIFLRTKPLMPYEIKSRGVKKFFGKTINVNSKINRRFNNIKGKSLVKN